MSIRVDLTYDMSKALGERSLELDRAATVSDAVKQTRERFAGGESDFDTLARVAAVAVNGVLMNYKRGLKTALSDGDTVAFVKAAAGG